ncbi:hypothetical protein DID96_29260 [Burkholderia sp. Bp8963]|uniref:hypothetical protein n=1 Tax=Burkholderia sp. Bp8963 TaxID=2184547 RepID=UPI000F5AACF5|nr:hypothetical protein [Burkholderia sp. Bp8963]RQS63664.1 hypothetical protein DID96_29260 [Burkholderia sp. Bp8963]
MGQTKLTAHLPAVEVEITRHELPERNAEAMTILITATPSFDATAQWLLQSGVFPLAAPLSFWAEAIQAWQRAWYPRGWDQLWQPVWQPWLETDSSPPVRPLQESGQNE